MEYSIINKLKKYNEITTLFVLDLVLKGNDNESIKIIENYLQLKQEKDLFILYLKDDVELFDKIQYTNLIHESKITNIFFIIGYFYSKNVNTIIFTPDLEKSPFKKLENSEEAQIKVFDLDFISVNLDFHYKDVKAENKLTAIFNEKVKKISNIVQKQNSSEKNFEINNFITNTVKNIEINLIKNPPKTYTTLFNTIHNTSQNSLQVIQKRLNRQFTQKEISMLILKEISNKKLFNFSQRIVKIIDSNIFESIDEINQLILEDENLRINLEINNNGEIIKTKNTKTKQPQNFEIDEKNIEVYVEILKNSQNLSYFVGNIFKKILENLNIMKLEKLPVFASKFKNFVWSFLNNNQDLEVISKNIMFIGSEKLAMILCEGIIHEMIIKNMIMIKEKNKILYNLKQIEIEKIRLNRD